MKEGNKNRKDEILSHQTEVNIDEIWAAIEPQVDLINAEKKRKKRFLFFCLLGVILLASGGLYMWQSEGGEEGTTSTFDIETTQRLTKKAQLDLPESSRETEAVSKFTDSQLADNQLNEESGGVLENKKGKAKISPTTTVKSAINTNENGITKGKFTTQTNLRNSTNKISNQNNLKQQINTKSETVQEEQIISPPTFMAENDAQIKAFKRFTLSPQISILKPQLPSFIPEVGEPNIAENEDESADEELPGGKLNFALAGNIGISFINRGLSSNIEGNPSPEVLALRRESETLLEAINYGVRGKLTHKSGFSLSTGAQYTVISERYDNNKMSVETDSIQGVIKRVVQLNGDTTDILGLIPRTTTYDYDKKIHNRYRMIDIPFIVGFEGGMEKWSLGIQAGVFVNLALKTSGQLRSTATQDLNIGENQSDVFKDRVGLSYYAGIYIRRELSPYLDLTVAPHGRFFTQEFNVADYDLKQKYGLIGVQVGLSYRFGY